MDLVRRSRRPSQRWRLYCKIAHTDGASRGMLVLGCAGGAIFHKVYLVELRTELWYANSKTTDFFELKETISTSIYEFLNFAF
ncbi:MAG: hypothetical protein GXX99_02570 [Clostridiales bacterium]|nr:hypothetical protein [Clostridiales bacterium]